jgi:hypothetical protein
MTTTIWLCIIAFLAGCWVTAMLVDAVERAERARRGEP